MPNYQYQCKSCEHTFEEQHKMDQRKEPEAAPCPVCEQMNVVLAPAAPAIGDAVRLGKQKFDSTFDKYVLGRIKKNNPGSTIGEKRQLAKEV